MTVTFFLKGESLIILKHRDYKLELKLPTRRSGCH